MDTDRRSMYLGIAVAAVLLLITAFAPYIASNDPLEVNLTNRLMPPDGKYPLGTDQLGRCVLSRLLYGARTSLSVTCMVLLLTVSVGTLIGIAAGVAGGAADKILMGVCDVILAFPGIILALVVSGLLGPGIMNIMLAVAAVSWAKYARICRSMVLTIKSADYIKAAKVSGTKRMKLISRHMIPNVVPVILTVLVTDIGNTILRIAGLSFIGLGAQPPQPEWGMMINEGRAFMDSAPGLIIFPIIAVCMTVAAFNLIGDGLRDKFDPRSY